MNKTKRVFSIIMAGILSLSPVMATGVKQSSNEHQKSTFAKIAGGMVLGCAVAVPATLLVAERVLKNSNPNDSKLIEDLNTKLIEKINECKRIEQLLKNTQETKNTYIAQLRATEEKRNHLQTQLEDAQQKCQNLQAVINSGNTPALQNELATARQTIVDLQRQIATANADCGRWETYAQDLTQRLANTSSENERLQGEIHNLQQQLASRPNPVAAMSPYMALIGEKLDLDIIMPKFMTKLKEQQKFTTFLNKVCKQTLDDSELNDLIKTILQHGYNVTLTPEPGKVAIAQGKPYSAKLQLPPTGNAKAKLIAAVTPLKTDGSIDTELDIKFFADLFIRVGINGNGIQEAEHHMPSPPPYPYDEAQSHADSHDDDEF